MAFPTTSVLTNFTQADGALPAAWTNDIIGAGVGTLSVASNLLVIGTFGRSAWWNAGTFGPDTEVFATVTTKPADGAGWMQLWARVQTPGSAAADGYKVELGPASGTDAVDVYRVINGVDGTSIATRSQEFTAGDKLGVEITGTGATVTIRLYRFSGGSWTQLGADISDTNGARIVSAGYIGVGGYQTADTMRIDDFGGGTVSGGTSATVTAVAAVGLGSAPTAAVTGNGSATVSAVPAAATADTPNAVITAGSTVTATTALALGSAPPANQIISSVVGAPASVALGSAPVPSVSGSGGTGATVTAVPALALGSAPITTMSAGSTVVAVAALAVRGAPVAVITGGSTVTAVIALALGQAPRPAITPAPPGGGGKGTVAATFAEAGG